MRLFLSTLALTIGMLSGCGNKSSFNGSSRAAVQKQANANSVPQVGVSAPATGTEHTEVSPSTSPSPGASPSPSSSPAAKKIVSIAITPASQTMLVSAQVTFTLTGTYDDGSTTDLTAASQWSSSAIAKVVVANTLGIKGRAQAVAIGTANVIATYTNLMASAPVTVIALPPTVTLSNISVEPLNPSLRSGQTIAMRAYAHYSDGSSSEVTSSATWTSANLGVATISTAGLVTAVAAGSSQLTASFNSKSASTVLTVLDDVPACTSFTASKTNLIVGDTLTLTATGSGLIDSANIAGTTFAAAPYSKTMTMNATGRFTYNAYLQNSSGRGDCQSLQVDVTAPPPPPPSCVLATDKSTAYAPGEEVILTVTGTNFSGVMIDGQLINAQPYRLSVIAPNVRGNVTYIASAFNSSATTSLCSGGVITVASRSCSLSNAGKLGTVISITDQAGLSRVMRGHSYRLANNITISGDYAPIPNATEVVFDGGGYTIRHLTHAGAPGELVGFIGELDCSIVKNLNLDDINFSGHGDVGGLAAHAHLSQIDHVVVTNGNVTSTCAARYDGDSPSRGTGAGSQTCGIGGLLGAMSYADPVSSSITDSRAAIDVKSPLNYNISRIEGAGGLVGFLSGGSIMRSSASGSVMQIVTSDPGSPSSTEGSSNGGLVGVMDNAAQVDLSFATGNVGFGGGLIGSMDRAAIVARSYSSGSVTIGAGLVNELDRDSKISQSYSTSNVQMGPGGARSLMRGSTVDNCYATGTSSIQDLIGTGSMWLAGEINGYYISNGAANGKVRTGSTFSSQTAAAMRTAAAYPYFDLVNIWAQLPGQLPKLKWQP